MLPDGRKGARYLDMRILIATGCALIVLGALAGLFADTLGRPIFTRPQWVACAVLVGLGAAGFMLSVGT